MKKQSCIILLKITANNNNSIFLNDDSFNRFHDLPFMTV